MSPPVLPVPAPCRDAYDRYAADLRRSALAATTRSYHDRCVRRFLRWLPGNAPDPNAALTQRAAWDAAVTRFTGHLAAANGPLSPDVQAHRSALADCARRLGLVKPYASVPDKFRWVYDAYAAAAATTRQSPATRTSNQNTVSAFLRWLDHRGYAGDLRSDWATAAAHYLQHLSGKGNAPSTVLRRRAALNDCAARLHLRPTTVPPPNRPRARADPPPDVPAGPPAGTT